MVPLLVESQAFQMLAEVRGWGLELGWIGRVDCGAQLTPTQPAKHQVGSRTLRLTPPQKCRRLGDLGNRFDPVGRFRGSFNRNQNSAADLPPRRSLACHGTLGAGLNGNLLDGIRFLLTLLLEKTMNEMAGRLQGRPHGTKRWPFIGEPRFTRFLKLREGLKASIQIFLALRVKPLGSFFKGRVEFLRREFAFLNGKITLFLGLVGLRLILVTDFASLLVVEKAVLGLLDHRNQLQT